MLPPAPVLDLIQKNGRLSIPSSDVYTVVQMVQSAWPDLDSTWGEKGLVERISKVCSIKDLTTIGTILFDHSVAGKPLGCKVLEICKNEGNMDAEFKYAHAISQGFPGQKRDLERSIALLESLVAKRHPLSTFVYALRLIKQATHQLPSPSTAAAASTPPAADIPKLTKGLRTLHACARELAFPQAQMQMGHLYLYGGLGVPRDAALAYPFLEGAARAGIPEAMFLCGVCWEKGDGTPGGVDFRKAFEWWTLAANKGLAIAQHNVASFFFGSHVSTSLSTPFPIEKNIPLALEYFEMAATQGLPLSLVNLAKLYKEGYRPLRGEPKFWAVAVDLNKARDYAERVTHLEGNWGDLGKSLLEDIDEERGVKN
ncbi:hypothetical protein BC830DRAFT_1139049 [Chytriomyces sp. MP71]|nr:hypothetical protein BC830DRAFT_1139049 [Chytriomyces sp. MP71]